MMSISRVWVLALISLVSAGRSVAGTIYVDTNATEPVHDGSSWCDAYLYLQDALAVATAGDEIRVADGVYKPDQGSGQTLGDRDATFQLINGVTIAGGYAGCGAPDPHERDIAVYETILSGDLAGDDVVVAAEDLMGEPTRAENSYHVMTGSGTDESASLDGCTVIGGHASESFPDSRGYGGGMYSFQGAPTVINSTFKGNFANNDGGGMYNSYSGPTVTDCTFSGNSASGGGGMNNFDGADPVVIGCTFRGNSAAFEGGGMRNWGSNPTITNCTFTGNTVESDYDGYGGGMYNSYSSPTVGHCRFSENSAYLGGGMFNKDSSPSVTQCAFTGNTAGYGGGMFNSLSNPVVTDCTFSRNSADSKGGGMQNSSSNSTITNCTFDGNWADTGGGGMYNVYLHPVVINCMFIGNSTRLSGCGGMENVFSRPWVINCTFTENAGSDGAAGGMYIFGNSATVTDCIFWDNVPPQIVNDSNSEITYSNVQGGYEGEGNMDIDPLFALGPAGCFYLSRASAGQAMDSPCIDVGSDTVANMGLSALTTRTDEAADTGIVDLGYHYPVTGLPLVMGDYDRNQLVNLADFAGLQNCLSGRGAASLSPCCRIFDFEPDNDVDLDDYAAFEAALSSG